MAPHPILGVLLENVVPRDIALCLRGTFNIFTVRDFLNMWKSSTGRDKISSFFPSRTQASRMVSYLVCMLMDGCVFEGNPRRYWN
jgi:hypothetical protein